MKKTLIVSATILEIQALGYHFGKEFSEGECSPLDNDTDVLITGVGIPNTIFRLTQWLTKHSYNQAINVGIAGAFDTSIALAQIVQVKEDCFSELGAEDGEGFISIMDLGFAQGYEVFTSAIEVEKIRQVSAITVNTVHGKESSIQQVQQRLNPQIETMEGAAFFFVCKQFSLKSTQIRAISNYVERRDRSKWRISQAVKALNDYMIDFLER